MSAPGPPSVHWVVVGAGFCGGHGLVPRFVLSLGRASPGVPGAVCPIRARVADHRSGELFDFPPCTGQIDHTPRGARV